MNIRLEGKRALVTGGNSGIGMPQEIARMVTVPVSKVASHLTGRTIFIDGGMTDYPDFAHGG